MSETAKENNEFYNSTNEGYNVVGVISLRLDTSTMLNDIESFLKGTKTIGYEEKDGVLRPVYATAGQPKMNDLGIQSVMSWLTSLLSPHTVQGNFPTMDDLDDYLIRLETDFFGYLMKNRHNFNISMDELDGIVDMFINTAEPFFTRLIQNKERESYANTIRSVESNRMERGGGLFGLKG